ncbi:hypothetical protein ACWD7Y_04630 [Streptomyces drozdowiczii]
MTSSSSGDEVGPSTEAICAALRVLGTKVPEEDHGLSRAEALGHLLMLVEGSLIVEDDPIALEAVRTGYFGGLVGMAKAYGFEPGERDAPLQEMWVRSLQLRLRRTAFDWSNLRQGLPKDTHEQFSAATVDSLLSAAAELLDPFYPRLYESSETYAARFRKAFRSVGAHIVSARKSIQKHRSALKERGYRA